MTLLLALSMMCQTDAKPAFPPLKVYNHNCEISETYEEIRDIGTLEASLGIVFAEGDHRISCRVLCFSKGRNRVPFDQNDNVYIHLKSTSKEAKLRGDDSFYTLYDDKRFSDLEPHRDSSVHNGVIIEQIMVTMTFKKYLAMILAKEIRCSVGSFKFTFTGNQQTAMVDLAARAGVDGKSALKLARQQAEAKAARIQEIRQAWSDVLTNARKAAQGIPKDRPNLRKKSYDKTIKEGKASVCDRFGLTLSQLKTIVDDSE